MEQIQVDNFPVAEGVGHQDSIVTYNDYLKQMRLLPYSAFTKSGMAARRWNETLSTPTGEAYGDIEYLRDLPDMLGLGCYLVKDNHQKRKLSKANHNFYHDGSVANLDGSEGQYMWCWNAFYYATWREGDYTYEAISLSPIPGRKNYRIPAGGYAATGFGYMDRETNTLCSVVSDSERYRGGNGNPVSGTQTKSNAPQATMLGMPASQMGIETFSANARKRGVGWEANWFVARAAVEVIIRIVMGSRNSQAPVIQERDSNGLYQGGFGDGVTTWDWSEWGNFNSYYPLVPSSAGIELGDYTGSFEYDVPNSSGGVFKTVDVPSFFGLKNFFGHLYFGTSGLLIHAQPDVTEVFVSPSMHDGWSHTSTEGMLKAGEMPRSNGYIKVLNMNRLCALPLETGGSASTYYCDYLYTNAQTSHGLRARFGGGRSSYGTTAGASYTYSSTAPTDSHANRSVPLCFFEEDPVVD